MTRNVKRIARSGLPVTGAALALACAIAAAGTRAEEEAVFSPPVVKTHGQTERNACWRDGHFISEDGDIVIGEPRRCSRQKPRAKPRRAHATGRVRVITKIPAEYVEANLRSGRRDVYMETLPVGDSMRRWQFYLPATIARRSQLKLLVAYENGSARFTMPLRRHRHKRSG